MVLVLVLSILLVVLVVYNFVPFLFLLWGLGFHKVVPSLGEKRQI